MGGFFVFGPIGGIAGLLAGIGLVLRFGGASARWGNGLLTAAGGTLALGSVLLAWAAAPESKRVYPQVLDFELELDEADWGFGDTQDDARWSYGPDGPPAQLISPFWEKRCANGRCIVQSMAALDAYRPNPVIAVRVHQKKRHFPVSLPKEISAPLDWSEWQRVEDMRLRYRVVLNQ